MAKSVIVRQHKFLPRYIYVIYIRAVNNMAATDANEGIALLAELTFDQSFDLPQLQSKYSGLIICQHKGRIVAIGGDVYNLLRSNTHQVGGS